MEFLKIAKRRSFVSDLLYNLLNVALAVAVLVVVLTAASPLPAFILIILSKWRVFAVRPRFWLANIQANLVDFIVSIGLVVLLYSANGNFILQLILTVLYVGWLLFLKPRSKRSLVIIQAAVATFVGVMALYMVSFAWPTAVVVILMWIIGYAAARHVLSVYDEAHVLFLSLVWGLFMAELGWLAFHWTFAYSLPGLGAFKIPQIAIIALAVGFVAERGYSSYQKHEQLRMSDLILPILLSVSLIIVLLVIYNEVSLGGA